MNKYKIISFIFLISLTTFSVAQDKQDKPDKTEFLPKAGDFSVGISLNPILNFAGNMFNPSYNSIDSIGGGVIAPPGVTNTSLFPTASIMGKYMITNKFAIRANIGVLIDRKNDTQYVVDDKAQANDPLTQAKIIDRKNVVRDGVSVSAGVEYRIGKGRVQGIFGGSLAYAYTMESVNYTYANAITEANQVPTIAGSSFSPGYIDISTSMPNARVLRDFTEKGSHTTGFIGHIGVECFVAPQISLGVEMNLSVFYSWTTDLYAELEGYNIHTKQVDVYTELLAPKSSSLVFGSNSISGTIFMNFYF